jgi:hypothetical protein
VTQPDGQVTPGSAAVGPGGGASDDDKGIGTHLNELLGLVIAYAKQETVVPIKSLGRFVAWGAAGAVLLAAGGTMLILTAVRVVQSETGSHLHGNLSWVPYTGGLIVAAGGVAWAGLRIVRGER